MDYTEIILTNHAAQKIERRGIIKNDVFETLVKPDSTKKDREDAFKYKKKFEGYRITAVAKQNEKGEWVILSVWRDPPLPGTLDAQEKKEWKGYKKAGFLGQIWSQIKQQLFS